jgi:hypothetical protein
VVFPAVSLPRIVADSNETLANMTNQTYIGFPIDPTYDVSWIGKAKTYLSILSSSLDEFILQLIAFET